MKVQLKHFNDYSEREFVAGGTPPSAQKAMTATLSNSLFLRSPESQEELEHFTVSQELMEQEIHSCLQCTVLQ